MKLTKVTALTGALALAGASVLLGVSVGGSAANATTDSATDTFHLYGQVNNNSLAGNQDLTSGRSITISVSPASATPGSTIEVKVSSSNFTICNGPAAAAAVHGEELDAVILLNGTNYALHGPQNAVSVPASPYATSHPPACAHALFNTGWVISSTAGNSSGTSDTTNTATTTGTGVGTFTRSTGAITANAAQLSAPASTGSYPIVLESLNANSTGTDSPYVGVGSLYDDFDEAFNIDSTNACSNSATCPVDNSTVFPGPGGTPTGTFTNNPGSLGAGSFYKNTAADYINPIGSGISLTVAGSAAKPDAPSAPHATAGNAQATVTWSAPSANGSAITGYTVTPSPSGATPCTTTGTLSCTVSGLTNGQAYTFTVTATNAIGTSDPSPASNSVTPKLPTAPGAPTGVKATAGNAKALVSWSAPSSNGGSPITGYTVTSAPGGDSCTTTGALSCTVSGLTNGTSYTFTVTAKNSVGTSAASSPSAAAKPVNPTGTPVSATANLATFYCSIDPTVQTTPDKYAGWKSVLTLTPGNPAVGDPVAASFSAYGSIRNSGPAQVNPGTERFEATLLVGKNQVHIIGPRNKTTVPAGFGKPASAQKPIFTAAELPTVAKGTFDAPSGGSYSTKVLSMYYNSFSSATSTDTKYNETFDVACNESKNPHNSPAAFSAPKVTLVVSGAKGSGTIGGSTTTDPSSSGGTLAATGARETLILGLLALLALQIGAVFTVRAVRAAPRGGGPRHGGPRLP